MSAGRAHGVYRLGEAIAALGVILSLLFVGVQIRQTAAVAGAQAAQDLAAMSQEFLLTLGADPEADRVFTATYWSMEPVSEAEGRRARYIMIAALRRAEAAFAQVERGLLPESALEAYGTTDISGRFENQRFLDFWAARRTTFNPAFVEFVERRSGRRLRSAP